MCLNLFVSFALFAIHFTSDTSATPIQRTENSNTSNEVNSSPTDEADTTSIAIPTDVVIKPNPVSLADIDLTNESLVLGMCIRGELVSIANGSHLIFPSDPSNLEGRHHRVKAVAITKMWTHLTTMEQIDEILVNASQEALTTWQTQYAGTPVNEESVYSKLLKTVFFKVEQAIRSDALLSSEYEKKTKEAEDEVPRNSEMQSPAIADQLRLYNGADVSQKLVQELYASPFARSFLVNKKFLSQAANTWAIFFSKPDFNQFMFARSLLHLASVRNTTDDLDRLYNEALLEATQEMAQLQKEKKVQTYSDALLFSVAVGDAFFGILTKKVGQEPSLQAELNAVKKDIIDQKIHVRYEHLSKKPRDLVL